MSDARKPDAIFYQERHKGPSPLAGTKVKAVQDRFGPVLGSPNVVSYDVPGAGILCVPDKDLNNRSYLTRDRQPRYEWVPQADEVLHGYLIASGGAPKPQPTPEVPASA